MYNWRFTSFVVFTSIFWGVEITCTALLWVALTIFLSSRTEPPAKSEPSEMAAVKHETDTTTEEPSRIIKREEEEKLLEDFPQATEADIEDEEEPDPLVLVGSSRRGIVSDSGLGTSLESSGTGKRDTIRRRSSRPPDGE
jgi:seipin